MNEQIQLVKGILGKYIPPKLLVALVILFAIAGLIAFFNDFRKSIIEISDLKQQMQLRSLDIAQAQQDLGITDLTKLSV